MRIFLMITSLLLLNCLTCMGQSEMAEDSISVLARSELNNRIEKFRLKKMEECKAEALRDAEAHVDSLIVAQVDLHLIDTISFPEKPVKPQFPESIQVKDSIKVKPIIDKAPKESPQ